MNEQYAERVPQHRHCCRTCCGFYSAAARTRLAASATTRSSGWAAATTRACRCSTCTCADARGGDDDSAAFHLDPATRPTNLSRQRSDGRTAQVKRERRLTLPRGAGAALGDDNSLDPADRGTHGISMHRRSSRRNARRTIATLTGALALSLAFAPGASLAQIINVGSTADSVDASPANGVCEHGAAARRGADRRLGRLAGPRHDRPSSRRVRPVISAASTAPCRTLRSVTSTSPTR